MSNGVVGVAMIVVGLLALFLDLRRRWEEGRQRRLALMNARAEEIIEECRKGGLWVAVRRDKHGVIRWIGAALQKEGRLVSQYEVVYEFEEPPPGAAKETAL